MWAFLQSNTGILFILSLVAALLAVVLLHSIFTRRAVRRMLDYKFAEMSVLSMLAEVERNREKYSTLTSGALGEISGGEALERMNYHLLAQCGGDPLGWILQQRGAAQVFYLVLWIRQEMRRGNFPTLFWEERSGALMQSATGAYRTIGALGCARVLEKTKESVDARLEKKGNPAALRRWVLEAAADDFRWYDKRERVRERLAEFLCANREQICQEEA